MNDDLISRQAAIDIVEDWFFNATDSRQPVEVLRYLPSAQPEIVRCWECFYRRRCMLQHFVESNAVDGAKIDWSEWYCADGVRDINVPNKSDERLEE